MSQKYGKHQKHRKHREERSDCVFGRFAFHLYKLGMDKSLPFRILYSDGKTSCKKCNDPIQIDTLQIAITVQSNEDDYQYPEWYDQRCFFQTCLPLTEASFDGFALLRYKDQMTIKEHLDVIALPDFGIEYSKGIEIRQNAHQNYQAKQFQSQNEEYYKTYYYLRKFVSIEDQRSILYANSQKVLDFMNSQQMLHHLTDVIYFGAPLTCTKCWKGQLIFNNTTYKCTYASNWTKCHNQDKAPQRKPAQISSDLLEKYPFLKPYQTTRNRILHAFQTTDKNGNDLVFEPYKNSPLFNMEFVIVGCLDTSKIVRTVLKLGGKITDKATDKVAAIISTKEEVEKMGDQMKEAKKFNVQVVSDNFLKEVLQEADPIFYIMSNSICEWGDVEFLYDRFGDSDIMTRREHSFYTRMLPKKVTYIWKDGTAVDSQCGLDNVRVYEFTTVNGKTQKYSVILSMVDIQDNKNSYYRMQLLESSTKSYWVFESWGRISTVIGNKRLTQCGTLEEAQKRFHEVYFLKTGVYFHHTISMQHFPKLPNKFYHHDVIFDIPKKIDHSMCKTKLAEPVYQLMEMLFKDGIMKMESMMMTCEFDWEQTPLGKISEKQINLAMQTLKDISRAIRSSNIGELVDLSNKFYTLIPHSMGVERPPIINSPEMVSNKYEMLESLMNMQLVYGFLNAKKGLSSNPLDACYDQLNAEIIPLDKESEHYERLQNAVKNGQTQCNYELEVLDIFKVIRKGEDERFEEFRRQYPEDIQNHRALLWHGSRLENFASILTNGLKTTAPEAFRDWIFRKSIYFADNVSKSAHYCNVQNNQIGLMLLCEVYLGKTKELYRSQHVTNLPNAEFQSVKEMGKWGLKNWVPFEGLPMPYSMFTSRSQNQTNIFQKLNYNEYIVYNPAQVKIKYLFKMKFTQIFPFCKKLRC